MKCEYCGSNCTDARGNCGACGAPKNTGEYVPSVDGNDDRWWLRMSQWNTGVASCSEVDLSLGIIELDKSESFVPLRTREILKSG